MKRISAFIAAVIFLSLVGFNFPVSAASSSESSGGAAYEGYIVKLKNDRTSRMSLFGAGVTRIDKGIYTADSLGTALNIAETDNIEYIEPNYYLTLYGFPYNGMPDDPGYDGQWWLEMIDVPGAWRSGMLGKGVKVAVIDSGLISGHEDIDYSHLAYGYNFSGSGSTSDITDQTGHGSFVTGIIAANINNSKGISGISDEVKLVELKCFTSSQTTSDKIISAIAAAREQKCDVINMSFGMENNSESLKNAIDAAVSEGMIVVAAVGNDGTQILNYPAAYENVIGVGSVDQNGSVSYFSQINNSVFVTAPGRNIVSLDDNDISGYVSNSGTSFSTPVVSAMAALAKSANRDIDIEDFKRLLELSSDDKGISGYDTSYGHGIVNVGAFVEKLQSMYTTYNNTDIVSVSVSEYPGVWDEAPEEYKTVIPAGTVPSTSPSSVKVITEDSGSVYTAVTDNMGASWIVTVTARDGETSRDYRIRLADPENNAPVASEQSYETDEDAAAPESYDGITAVRKFEIDDVSVWFDDDGSADSLEYYAEVKDSTGVAATSGPGLTFVPAAADAGKTVTVRVRASDGQFFSSPVLVNIHVGALPESQSILTVTSASYDKYQDSADNNDIEADLLLYGNTLTAVRRGDEALAENTAYGIVYGETDMDSSSVTVHKSYLDKLPVGDTALTFEFSAGNSAQMLLAIADTTPLYTVSFMDNGVQHSVAEGVRKGSTTPLPTEPARQGYDFIGWYMGENGTGTAFTSQTPVNSEMTLYAYRRIKQIEDGGGQTPGGGGGGGVPGSVIPPLPGAEFAITTEASAGGTVSGGGKAAQGSDAGLIIKPDNGYEVSDITIDGKPADVKSLTDNRDGTWTLKIQGIAADHVIKVEFKEVPKQPVIEENPIVTLFSDISETAWYKDSVRFVIERELFNGTGGGQFSPQLNMTRSMFVSVLGRLSGTVADGGPSAAAFKDVKNNSWYAPYVSWASDNGIVSGYGNGTFGPDDHVSREQMALFLYRYAKLKGLDMKAVSESSEMSSRFSDAADVSPWAMEAVEWAAAAGLVSGKPGNVFDPKGKATRAEVAAIIHRFVEGAEKLP